MFEKDLVVKNKTGLHARPAAELVQLAKKYKSNVELLVDNNGKETVINAKSIMMVMAGGLHQGKEFKLRIEGEDEQEAGPAIVDYINNLTE